MLAALQPAAAQGPLEALFAGQPALQLSEKQQRLVDLFQQQAEQVFPHVAGLAPHMQRALCDTVRAGLVAVHGHGFLAVGQQVRWAASCRC